MELLNLAIGFLFVLAALVTGASLFYFLRAYVAYHSGRENHNGRD